MWNDPDALIERRSRLVLGATNIALHVIHVVFIVFFVTGWVFCETRLWHLVVLGLVGFSWFGLGAFMGLGYCFITDIHWRLRERMGMIRPSGGYMKFIYHTLLKIDADDLIIDRITYVVAAFCTISSVILSWIKGTC